MTAGTRARISPVGDESRRAAGGQPRRGNGWRRAAIAVGLAVLLLAIALAAAFPQQLKHQWELSVMRQPTPYTQLYFSAPGAIPSHLVAGQRNAFDFTIENDEGRPYTYTYTVTLEDSHARQQVGQETVTVGSGERVTRSAAVVPEDKNSRYLVTVTIPGLKQSIHFYGKTS